MGERVRSRRVAMEAVMSVVVGEEEAWKLGDKMVLVVLKLRGWVSVSSGVAVRPEDELVMVVSLFKLPGASPSAWARFALAISSASSA